MATSFANRHGAAWSKLGLSDRARPGEIFPTFSKKDFEKLKDDYTAQYGYTIRIPQLEDIIHVVPNAMKTEVQIKQEKKEGLTRFLDSPAPGWFQKYSTAMTFIDDVQDTASIIFPMVRLIVRQAPKALAKFLSAAGWLLLPFDILNLLNALGRVPLSPMPAKRASCRFTKTNPRLKRVRMGLIQRAKEIKGPLSGFSKDAQLSRINRIKGWKPGIADLLQVAQTTDQLTGVGLSFGPIMGTIYDTIFGAYHYIKGGPVRFTFDPPDTTNLTNLGSRALKAAAAISTQGQTFEELTHFWTYQTAAMSSMLIAGNFKENMLVDMVEDPMNIALPAPEPTDPLTIAVIQEAGLNVQDGIGWPFNGEKEISMGDFIDATAEPCQQAFIQYCNRHEKDWYGWATAAAMDSMIPQVLLSLEPDSSLNMDDTPAMKVFFRMVKAPILPVKPFTQAQAETFFRWVDDYSELYEEGPGIQEIESKLDQVGIRFERQYPANEAPDFSEFWPPGFRGEESF